MAGKIFGRLRRSSPREVGRCTNNGHLYWSHYPDGNHIRRDAVPRTYPHIVTLRHDIDRLVAYVEFELDLRVG